MLISLSWDRLWGLVLALESMTFGCSHDRLKTLELPLESVFLPLPSTSSYLLSPHRQTNYLFEPTPPTGRLSSLLWWTGGNLSRFKEGKSNVIQSCYCHGFNASTLYRRLWISARQWSYFFGALYLFLINTVLIATSTTLIVRYLRFPLVEILDPVRARKQVAGFPLAW